MEVPPGIETAEVLKRSAQTGLRFGVSELGYFVMYDNMIYEMCKIIWRGHPGAKSQGPGLGSVVWHVGRWMGWLAETGQI